MFSYRNVLLCCYCKRIPVIIFNQIFFCRGKFWRVSGVYMDHDYCSLRCPSDVITMSKLKKNNKKPPNSSILSAILQKKQVILINPCLCFIGCATIFVLIVEESLYICDWCYIWTNAFCLFFYFIIINFFLFFNKIKFVSFNRMLLVYKQFDYGRVRSLELNFLLSIVAMA